MSHRFCPRGNKTRSRSFADFSEVRTRRSCISSGNGSVGRASWTSALNHISSTQIERLSWHPYVYVSNGVQRIRKFTKSKQWHYLCTTQNPVDHATRSVPTVELNNMTWLTGPPFLWLPEVVSTSLEESFELIAPDLDTEVRSHATVLCFPPSDLRSHRFERFSSWKSLVRAIAFLIHIAQF